MKGVIAWLGVAAAALVFVIWNLASNENFALEHDIWPPILGAVVAALALGMAFVTDAEGTQDAEAGH